MLMVLQPDKLNPLGERLLTVLRSAGGEWLTRNQIAALIERFGSRLTPYDIGTLNFLVKEGLIEAREQIRGVAATRWEYRAKVE